ncbi:MAG: ATPase V [Bacteroidales bacterium]|nr:ATPase V [Candidatus Physcousia equi]
MIGKMTKYTFLVYHQEYDAFLKELREVGVLHVKERESGEAADNSLLHQLLSEKTLLDELKKDMVNALGKSAHKSKTSAKGLEVIQQEYAEFAVKRNALQQELANMEQEHAQLLPWGKIDWARIAQIEEAGYDVAFYSTTFLTEEDRSMFNLIEVGESGSRRLFLAVNPKGRLIELMAEKIFLPHKDVDDVFKAMEAKKEQIRTLEEQKKAYVAEHLQEVNQALALLQDSINLESVKLNTGAEADKHLCLLEGFCPNDKVEELDKMLDAQSVWYSHHEATVDDKAPVKIINNKLVSLFESLTRMYGLPSAKDVDPTAILGIFFTLFFAICIADAGYGIVLTLLSLADIKSGGKIGKVLFGINFKLVLVLGIACIPIGLILGTAFGIPLHEQAWMPDALKNCMLVGNFPGTPYDIQMVSSLLIGIFHLAIAMTVNAINVTKHRGFKECLGTWGWWLAFVGSATTAGLTFWGVIPQTQMMPIIYAILGISAVGIYFLNNIHRNPLMNFLVGLYDTYNMASGLMGDILSYIRLFALGMAGGMLGKTFNDLASMMLEGDKSIVALCCSVLGFVVIILIGHVLNIAMSCLSAFVHPLRLSFVEYFKNAGYEGKGVEYKPFVKTEE